MTGTGGLTMDYQEAIELLKGEIKCSCYRNRGYCGICTIYSEMDRDKIIDACKCAISAIQELKMYKDGKLCLIPEDVFKNQCEELDAYKEIGTLEEFQLLKATHLTGVELVKISCALKQLEKYKQLGTLEEVRDAVEKQRAISRAIIEGKYFCPKCHNLMPYPGYCGCGQKLY